MLTVSENRRYILKNGKRFNYLADTAWTALQKLTRKEMLFYLDTRKEQGFNAIHVCLLSELDGIRKPNREGFLPFFDGDVNKPCLECFDLALFFIDECLKRGMVPVVLPTWGDKFNIKEGLGPEIFTAENAYTYGEFVGRLIGEREDVIWMLGGDRPLENEYHFSVVEQMAKGIRAGEESYHLMTFHPQGEASSADFLAGKDYIDFHSIQSSHAFGGFLSEEILKQTLEKENKPCIDAECFYEDFPIGFNTEWGYRITPADIRKRIYRNLLNGAFGHAYGHQSVWRFQESCDEEYIFDWRESLRRPMAEMMKNVNILSDYVNLSSLTSKKIACNAESSVGEGFALIYFENNDAVFIDPKSEYELKSAEWFNTVNGEFSKASIKKQKNTVISPFDNDAVFIVYF